MSITRKWRRHVKRIHKKLACVVVERAGFPSPSLIYIIIYFAHRESVKKKVKLNAKVSLGDIRVGTFSFVKMTQPVNGFLIFSPPRNQNPYYPSRNLILFKTTQSDSPYAKRNIRIDHAEIPLLKVAGVC